MRLKIILAILTCTTLAQAGNSPNSSGFPNYKISDFNGVYKLDARSDEMNRCHKNVTINAQGSDTLVVKTDTVLPSGALFTDVMKVGSETTTKISHGRSVTETIEVSLRGNIMLRSQIVSDCNILGFGCDDWSTGAGWEMWGTDLYSIHHGTELECSYIRIK